MPGTTKKYVVGLDIGIGNMAMCVWDLRKEEDGYVPYLEHSSLLATLDGDLYKEYTEKHAPEIVYRWLLARRKYFQQAKLIGVEKQMADHTRSTVVRKTIVIETAIKSFLFQKGMPPTVSVNPTSWKKFSGVPCTKDYKKNKKISENLACRKWGPEAVKKLKKENPGKIDDLADAYWIGRYLALNYEKLLETAKVNANHNWEIGKEGNISKESRKRPRHKQLRAPPSPQKYTHVEARAHWTKRFRRSKVEKKLRAAKKRKKESEKTVETFLKKKREEEEEDTVFPKKRKREEVEINI